MDALQTRNASLSGFRGAEYQAAIGVMDVYETQVSGVAGGTFTSGAWRIRNLNLVANNDIPGSDVSALPAITLPRGVYHVVAKAIANNVNLHVARLWDVTAGAILLVGAGTRAPSGAQSDSWLVGRIVLSGDTQIRLEHRCETTNNDNGFGDAVGSSFAVEYEIYAILSIWKLG